MKFSLESGNDRPPSASLLRLLDMAAILLLLLVVSFRMMSAGQALDSITTPFCELLTLFAAFIWVTRILARRKVAIMLPKVWLAALLFLVIAGVSALNAAGGGDFCRRGCCGSTGRRRSCYL